MTTTVTREFIIDAAHRLQNHDGKCKRLHGHTYRFSVQFTGTVQADGMLADFGILKRIVGDWLDTHWDHRTLLERTDPLVEQLGGEHVALLDFPPSAENLARVLFNQTKRILAVHHVQASVTAVTCRETPSCYARFIGPL